MIKVQVRPGGPGPPNSNSIICLISIFRSYFFKSILCVKTGEVEVNRCWKMKQQIVTLTKHDITGTDLHCAGPLALKGFLQHLPAKYKWRPMKVLLSERGTMALCHMANTALVLHCVHKKFRWGPDVATPRTKALDLTLVIRLNWLKKLN